MNQYKNYRSQLLNTLRQAYHITLHSRKKQQPGAEQLFEINQQHSQERRQFLSNITKAGIAVSAAGIYP